MNIAPKTAAAGAGGSVAVAFVTILDWVLSFWHYADGRPISLPGAVGAAIATVLAAGGAWLAPKQKPTEKEIAEIKKTQ